ncbi:SusC/RagA family TonB-linked outer membrane protein [Prolixibacteraceae bacterium JC049]|nr:SusC/RagA family TonB-linked outer membrane protein [Prolixibacteraceae bacterium JC049]
MKKKSWNCMCGRYMLKSLVYMKLTLIFMLVSLLHVHASVYGQSKRFNLKMKNATVESVFKAIEEQGDYAILFKDDNVNLTRKVSVAVENETVDKVLNQVFRGTQNRYVVADRHIVITKSANAIVGKQKKDVTLKGKVTDEKGELLPGVSVVVKGTTIGVVTNLDGAYSLVVPADTKTVVFSFVGMATQEIELNGQTTLDVVLKTDAIGLDEVVAVGYGVQRKESLTGAISSVKTEQLTASTEASVASALVGKLGGISSRQNSGKPGAGANIQIRNLGTPLYIIDGIQKDAGQFGNLDANDIESITVLKDASAAIYGVQASNGVIVVTTKKGKKNGANTINVSLRHGIQNFTRFPKMMNAAQWVDHMVERDMNLYGKTNYTREEYDKWQKGTEPGYQSFDWRKFIVNENAPQTYAHVDASGGTDKVVYYLSYSQVNQEGMFNGYGFGRNNLQANVEADLAHGFKIGMNLNGRVEKRDGIMTTLNWDHFYIFSEALFRNRPTERPYANDNPDYPADNGKRTYVNTAVINKANSGSWVDTWRVLQTNVFLTYDTPIKGLTAKAVASYYYANNEYDGQKYNTKAYTYDKANDVYNVTSENTNRYKERRYSSVEERMLRGQLNYIRDFEDHKINAVFAAEMTERKTPKFVVKGKPTTNSLSLLKKSEFTDLYNGYGETARAGVIGRVNYTYKNKYIAEISGRYDGSYKFRQGKRWGLFPAVALGYRISEENFWKNTTIASVFDDFKVRGSYGKMGDDSNVGGFDYYDGYNFDRGKYIMGPNQTVIGVEQRGLPATNISWVKTINFNIGFDATMFDQKLQIGADFFTRKREGLLAHKNDIVLPAEVGFGLPKDNLESDMNIGWDAMIEYRDKVGEFSYNVGFNIGFSRRKTVDKYNPQFATAYHYWRDNQENRWQGRRWGYLNDGQFQSQEQIDNHPINNDGKGNRTMRPGDIIYKDLNGDKIIDWRDTRVIGYPSGLPLLNYGINISMNWKGFDLYMLWQGAGKYNYYRDWEVQKPAPGDGNSPAFLADRWHREDPFDLNSKWIPGKYPSTGSWSPWQNNNYDKPSDFWLHNVNYIRLKNIELGYNFSKSMLDGLGIKALRLYVSGTNLLTFDNLKIVDPEITRTNAVSYPQVKTLNVGCKVTF